MKPIYIGREESRKKKIFIVLALLIGILIILRMILPNVIAAYINKTGSDEKGYVYRVEDMDLSLLKGEVKLEGLYVHKASSETNFVEAKDITFKMDPTRIFEKEKIFSVNVGSLDFLISKDFFEEVNRVKNEAKEKADASLYIEDLKATIGSINVRQIRDDKAQPIMTLKDTKAHVTDLGVGSRKEKTEFEVTSSFQEGGKLDVSGKTKLEEETTPWIISGEMKQIPAAVLEKLAGDKLPVDIASANVDAAITAHSGGGQIEGEIVPEIKDFKLSEEKDEGVIKKSLAKAANFLFDKAKGKDQEVSLKLPFTLNENFTVNVPDTLEKITK